MPEPAFLRGRERLEVIHDPATGARGFIAVHSTALGPAMGGLRLYAYDSPESAASDADELARAMTLKNAVAGLDLGGGKAVLLDDGAWSSPEVRRARMRAVGAAIERLNGSYVTAEDVGTTPDDMEAIGTVTGWVAGRPAECGGQGDPSPATARTVFSAIESAVRLRLGAGDLAGVKVGVQGVGHVGAHLADLLCRAGAEVVITDANARRAVEVGRALDVALLDPLDFHRRDFEVFAPCALGGVIAPGDIAALRCSVVAGAANNPLSDWTVAQGLADAGILYVPDFVANCGGIIHVGAEVLRLDRAGVEQLTREATARTDAILRDAAAAGTTPWSVAIEHARQRILAATSGGEAAA